MVLLLLLSAFFSISETSMMALNRFRLGHLVRQGRTGATVAAELLGKTDRLLGTILLGNALAQVAPNAAHILSGGRMGGAEASKSAARQGA